MANTNLHNSRRDKFVEFYTRLEDIENELYHYTEHFVGKTVFCNCDDPYESNFFYYFATRFNDLKLKKLICTCYDGSPMAYTQMSFFDDMEKTAERKNRRAYKVVITDVKDLDGNGTTNIYDINLLLRQKGVVERLKGNGDFRSAECVELLKESDIVVTNPPFSLFREYIAQLIEYGKDFLIIGKIDAITYKEVFPLIKRHYWYKVPFYYEEKNTDFKIDDYGQKWRRMGNICWYTNLDIEKRHEDFIFVKRYEQANYQKYENCNAISVDFVDEIPDDYWGMMGVPITFIGKYNPKQFELLGIDKEFTTDGCRFKIKLNGQMKTLYARLVIRRKR